MDGTKKKSQHRAAGQRILMPDKTIAKDAHVSSFAAYKKIYAQSIRQPLKYWENWAKQLHWDKKWTKVLDWKLPHSKWFVGGKTNMAYNCLDVHVKGARKNKAAIIWESEEGEVKTFTYSQVLSEVSRIANGLKALGVKKGDTVTLYMGMVPELVFSVLACARIGAPHSVVFGGFSSHALRDRMIDADSHYLITIDCAYRRGQTIPLKAMADEALKELPFVKKVLVFQRGQSPLALKQGRDVAWNDLKKTVNTDCAAVMVDAEHRLFMLYTSGTTGKPKGIVHTTGGYMVGALSSSKWVFDLKDTDIFWCTADVGWITGHSYLIYGPLLNGATALVYEGAPNFPDEGRFWNMIERHQVSIFYTAPTAIRAFISWGDEWPSKYDLSSLRLLGSVGEPINPEVWMWYYNTIGRKKCPIVDSWWQTETGSIMISPLPFATPLKPGSATFPMPGIEADIVSMEGKAVKPNEGGYLIIKKPWPSMARTIHGDDPRFKSTYWNTVKGSYFTGDGAFRDKDGYFWVLGRIDDVINVSGHRLGTAEVESALVSHPKVAESAVIGVPHEIKGDTVYAFAVLKNKEIPSESLEAELKKHVVEQIGAIARPDKIQFVQALPKTRSGKIMRRLLRDMASGKQLGDMTTLEDKGVLDKLRNEEG